MMSLVKSCESTLSLEKNMVIALRTFLQKKPNSGHVCKIDPDGKTDRLPCPPKKSNLREVHRFFTSKTMKL